MNEWNCVFSSFQFHRKPCFPLIFWSHKWTKPDPSLKKEWWAENWRTLFWTIVSSTHFPFLPSFFCLFFLRWDTSTNGEGFANMSGKSSVSKELHAKHTKVQFFPTPFRFFSSTSSGWWWWCWVLSTID